MAIGKQQVSCHQHAMTTEVDLGFGSQPAKVVAAVDGVQETSFGQVHLLGDQSHSAFVGRFGHDTHRGRNTPVGFGGENIYDDDILGHWSSPGAR